MIKVKVKLIGKGTEDNPFRVDLPTWTMEGEPDYKKKECCVSIPDDELIIKEGKVVINQDKIRVKYKKGWGYFDKSEVEIKEDKEKE